jgi:hypothetical protein
MPKSSQQIMDLILPAVRGYDKAGGWVLSSDGDNIYLVSKDTRETLFTRAEIEDNVIASVCKTRLEKIIGT